MSAQMSAVQSAVAEVCPMSALISFRVRSQARDPERSRRDARRLSCRAGRWFSSLRSNNVGGTSKAGVFMLGERRRQPRAQHPLFVMIDRQGRIQGGTTARSEEDPTMHVIADIRTRPGTGTFVNSRPAGRPVCPSLLLISLSCLNVTLYY